MLDEDFKLLDRSAISLQPKQPFIDWLNHIFQEQHEALPFLPEVYLIPSYDTEGELQRWLKKNFNELFEEQLFNWYTDEDGWPKKRTFKMFEDWFDIRLITTIWDTQKGFIEKR